MDNLTRTVMDILKEEIPKKENWQIVKIGREAAASLLMEDSGDTMPIAILIRELCNRVEKMAADAVTTVSISKMCAWCGGTHENHNAGCSYVAQTEQLTTRTVYASKCARTDTHSKHEFVEEDVRYLCPGVHYLEFLNKENK